MKSDWRIPADWMVLLPISVGPAIVGVLLALCLPTVHSARQGDPASLLIVLGAMLLALVGIPLAIVVAVVRVVRKPRCSETPPAEPLDEGGD